jgi:hypothetical protein
MNKHQPRLCRMDRPCPGILFDPLMEILQGLVIVVAVLHSANTNGGEGSFNASSGPSKAVRGGTNSGSIMIVKGFGSSRRSKPRSSIFEIFGLIM